MLHQQLSIAMLLICLFLVVPCAAQEEVAGADRYRHSEVSNGYYTQYEVKPGRGSPFVQWSRDATAVTSGGRAVPATYQADAHSSVANYRHQRCESCHKEEAINNRHATRAAVQCVQCHGKGVVAGINHYFSPLNPIRRHAYVCAKCHQGASASFALYMVHEPKPLHPATASTFPGLFWAAWIMLGLALVTFGLFVPHTSLWMVRELFTRTRHGGDV